MYLGVVASTLIFDSFRNKARIFQIIVSCFGIESIGEKMKVRDRTIHDIHQIFCRDVYAWKELTKEQSYVQYILERGLAHIWTVKGQGKV